MLQIWKIRYYNIRFLFTLIFIISRMMELSHQILFSLIIADYVSARYPALNFLLSISAIVVYYRSSEVQFSRFVTFLSVIIIFTSLDRAHITYE